MITFEILVQIARKLEQLIRSKEYFIFDEDNNLIDMNTFTLFVNGTEDESICEIAYKYSFRGYTEFLFDGSDDHSQKAIEYGYRKLSTFQYVKRTELKSVASI